VGGGRASDSPASESPKPFAAAKPLKGRSCVWVAAECRGISNDQRGDAGGLVGGEARRAKCLTRAVRRGEPALFFPAG